MTALSAVLALSACSDDGGDDKEALSDRASVASEAPSLDCGAAVKISGEVEASWSGDASPTQVSETGQTVYESQHMKDRVVVRSASDEHEASVELTIGDTTYTASGDGVEAEADGSGAEIETETSAPDGAGPRIIASFVCD